MQAHAGRPVVGHRNHFLCPSPCTPRAEGGTRRSRPDRVGPGQGAGRQCEDNCRLRSTIHIHCDASAKLAVIPHKDLTWIPIAITPPNVKQHPKTQLTFTATPPPPCPTSTPAPLSTSNLKMAPSASAVAAVAEARQRDRGVSPSRLACGYTVRPAHVAVCHCGW